VGAEVWAGAGSGLEGCAVGLYGTGFEEEEAGEVTGHPAQYDAFINLIL
jgi:hypothetical protein